MIFWAAAPSPLGSEQLKLRPWVIVSNDQLHSAWPIVQAVPLTTQDKALLDHRVQLSNPRHFVRYQHPTPLSSPLVALTEQVRVLAHERLMPRNGSSFGNASPAGQVNELGLGLIAAGLAWVFDTPLD